MSNLRTVLSNFKLVKVPFHSLYADQIAHKRKWADIIDICGRNDWTVLRIWFCVASSITKMTLWNFMYITCVLDHLIDLAFLVSTILYLYVIYCLFAFLVSLVQRSPSPFFYYFNCVWINCLLIFLRLLYCRSVFFLSNFMLQYSWPDSREYQTDRKQAQNSSWKTTITW